MRAIFSASLCAAVKPACRPASVKAWMRGAYGPLKASCVSNRAGARERLAIFVFSFVVYNSTLIVYIIRYQTSEKCKGYFASCRLSNRPYFDKVKLTAIRTRQECQKVLSLSLLSRGGVFKHDCRHPQRNAGVPGRGQTTARYYDPLAL